MAKLSAHGQTELWRVAKDGHKYALMSSGKLLKTCGYGWKVCKRKEGLTDSQIFDILVSKGYEKVNR